MLTKSRSLEDHGRVAKCQRGILGVVQYESNGVWYGVSFEGGNWESRKPEFVADSVDRFIGKYYVSTDFLD